MSPHPHLTYFDENLSDFRDVRLFYLSHSFQGMWQEQMVNSGAKNDGLLVLVKLGDKLYRYNSPQPIDTQISQVTLAFVIRKRLDSSLRYRAFRSVSNLFSIIGS
jgi:hypothetical protein